MTKQMNFANDIDIANSVAKVCFRKNDSQWNYYKLGLTNTNSGPEHEMLVLIAYAKKTPLSTLADLFSGAEGLNLDLSLHTHYTCTSVACVREQRML